MKRETAGMLGFLLLIFGPAVLLIGLAAADSYASSHPSHSDRWIWLPVSVGLILTGAGVGAIIYDHGAGPCKSCGRRHRHTVKQDGAVSRDECEDCYRARAGLPPVFPCRVRDTGTRIQEIGLPRPAFREAVLCMCGGTLSVSDKTGRPLLELQADKISGAKTQRLSLRRLVLIRCIGAGVAAALVIATIVLIPIVAMGDVDVAALLTATGLGAAFGGAFGFLIQAITCWSEIFKPYVHMVLDCEDRELPLWVAENRSEELLDLLHRSVGTKASEISAQIETTEGRKGALYATGSSALDRVIVKSGRLAGGIGIETLGGMFTPLLDIDIEVPCEYKQVLSTTRRNQEEIDIRVFQGYSSNVEENREIGIFSVSGIPPVAKGVPQIEFCLRVQADGVFVVEAQDLRRHQQMSVKKKA